MHQDRAVAELLDWASTEENVRAVLLTGSAAAGTAHPLSDRDLEIHAVDTGPLEAKDGWWSELGEVLAVERLTNAADEPTRLIYYTGGKLDFTLVAVDGRSRSFDGPFAVLLDKDGLTAEFSVTTGNTGFPNQRDFDECCHWAAAAAMMMARAIARDEPWSQLIRDGDLKAELLRMIEWTHLQRHGPSHDIHHLGNRMRQWMDPQVQSRLEHCGITLCRDNRAPLLATIDLFASLSGEVAGSGELTPFDLAKVRQEVRRILGLTTG